MNLGALKSLKRDFESEKISYNQGLEELRSQNERSELELQTTNDELV